jgi:hypothetical protein
MVDRLLVALGPVTRLEAGAFKFLRKSAFYDVDATSAKKRCSVKRNLENVALITTTSRKQHADHLY